MTITKLLATLLVSSFIFAQTPVAAQQKQKSVGFVLSAEGQYWEQKNFNTVLNNLNLPSAPSFALAWGAGAFWRFTNFEFGMDGRFGFGRRSGATDRITQSSGLGNLFFKQHFNFSKGSFYPTIGIGVAGAKSEITQRNGPQNITAALTSRNTTTLFNRQAFVVFGLGTQLFESNRRRGFYNIEAGYRLGFAATEWSTDEESGDYMTNSVTDELGQFYLKLGIGILRVKGSRRDAQEN